MARYVNTVNRESGSLACGLRDALLDAATMAVEVGGAEAVSLRELTRALGVTAPATYRHFASRSALLDAVAARGHADLAAAFDVATAEASDPRAALLALGLAYVAFARARPHLFALMFAGPRLGGPDPLAEAGRASFARLLDAVAAHLGPRVRPEEARLAALRLWATAHGAAALSLAGHLVGAVEDQERLAELLGPALDFGPLRDGRT